MTIPARAIMQMDYVQIISLQSLQYHLAELVLARSAFNLLACLDHVAICVRSIDKAMSGAQRQRYL
jgi:hypothetical protein